MQPALIPSEGGTANHFGPNDSTLVKAAVAARIVGLVVCAGRVGRTLVEVSEGNFLVRSQSDITVREDATKHSDCRPNQRLSILNPLKSWWKEETHPDEGTNLHTTPEFFPLGNFWSDIMMSYMSIAIGMYFSIKNF